MAVDGPRDTAPAGPAPTNDWLRQYQEQADKQQTAAPYDQGVCPACGYCPYCGRGHQTMPWPRPYYWYTITAANTW